MWDPFSLIACVSIFYLSNLSMAMVATPRASPAAPIKVVVVGAGTDVGCAVVQKMMNSKVFEPIAVVDSKREMGRLKKFGMPIERIHIADIVNKQALQESRAFSSADKCIICSSAKAKERWRFRLSRPWRSLLGKKRPPLPSELKYTPGHRPYEVDYLGQKNVVDECLKHKLQHVVLLGCMGGKVLFVVAKTLSVCVASFEDRTSNR